MHLVEIELFAEASEPYLGKERLVEIQELVRLVIVGIVRLPAQVLGAGHARARVDVDAVPVAVCASVPVGSDAGLPLGCAVRPRLRRDDADERLLEHFVGGIGMRVGRLVLEDLGDVLAGVLQYQVGAAGMRVEEIGHIVHVGPEGNIARLRRLVGLDLAAGERGEGLRRHGGLLGLGCRGLRCGAKSSVR